TFSVGEPSAAPTARASESDQRLRAAIWFARFVLYVGLFVGVGGAFYICWIAVAAPSQWTTTAITIAMQCGIAAALISVALQGIAFLAVLCTYIGDPIFGAVGLGIFYGLTLAIAIVTLLRGLASRRARRRPDRWYAAAALGGVGPALAASGHAATAAPPWIM